MSYRKYLTRYGFRAGTGEIRFSIYLTDPATLTTPKDIIWRDKHIVEDMTRLETVLEDLRDYRKDLAKRYGELETMPYTRTLKLERRPHWKGHIEYIVTITRKYSDKTEIDELREVYSGKERKKAFDRTAELLKQNPGIPYLGFRPSELLDLDVSSYDRTKKAFVGGAKTEAGKDRTVTVSPKILPIITQLTDKKIAGPVFCDADGSRMPIETYRKKFYQALDACGIDNPNGIKRRKYTPHSCRHTFSTLMKNVQAPDKDKLALIGHTSTEMLRHYQDVDIEGLRRFTNAM